MWQGVYQTELLYVNSRAKEHTYHMIYIYVYLLFATVYL